MKPNIGIAIFLSLIFGQSFAGQLNRPGESARRIEAAPLYKILQSIQSHNKNLSVLEHELISLDAPSVQQVHLIYSIGDSATGELTCLLGLAVLFNGMVHPIDRDTVRKMIGLDAQAYAETCPSGVETITKLLASTQNPAVVSEGERLRDELAKSCEFVKGWTPP